jgi:tetratricopeptide (TPR) repeat protein
MAKSKKICFVIMGFGKKTDYSTGKTLDLDKTYKNIIQPAVVSSGFQCVRADEIQDSGLIDKSMYALLMQAELVVADISTFNPNAIYELGIRHAVRPYSTIVIKEEEGKIPFDLDHTRIFHYKHLGEDIGADEAMRCQQELKEKIERITGSLLVDSPLYDFIKNIEPPKIPQAEYKKIIGDLAEREIHIFAIVEKAKECMLEGRFIEAVRLWEKAAEMVPSEDFFLQQQALATYKSKSPSEITALADALNVIERLAPDGESNDPETLGLTGAIYKRMWLLNSDPECLKRAIKFYEKGFQIRNDYYTGENYALCLDMMAAVEKDAGEKIYYQIAAKKARKQIVNILEDVEDAVENGKVGVEFKWALATLSNCYFGLREDEKGKKFEGFFLDVAEAQWERDTFLEAKAKLFELVRG